MRRPSLWQIPDSPFRARDVSVSDDVIHRAVKAGRVVRLRQGVFIDARAVPSDARERLLLEAHAHQLVHPDHVASHHTAAMAHALALPPGFDPVRLPPSFTAPPVSGRRSTRSPRVYVRMLPPTQIRTLRSGLRVTTPGRTAVDLAVTMDCADAMVVLTAAARSALVATEGRRELRRPPSRRTRQAMLEPLVDALSFVPATRGRALVLSHLPNIETRCESAGESYAWGLMVAADLELPVAQFQIVADGRVFYVDFAWPAKRLVLEVDGLVKYSGDDAGRAVANERHRHDAIQRAGWQVFRWLVGDIFAHPETFVADVGRRLEA